MLAVKYAPDGHSQRKLDEGMGRKYTALKFQEDYGGAQNARDEV